MQLLPQRIGPYQVLRMLGAGGMGMVYEVQHPRFPRTLALKVVNTRTASERALGRFWREAELLARIKHPGVVAIHQLGQSPDGPYIVEDLVAGQPLDELVDEGFLPERAVQIARDLAEALEAVHAEGILHRDLKPANVMLNQAGKPVLLDFGLARDVNAEQLTRTGDLIGTPAYMSPEQARGNKPDTFGPQVDVYGLGTILFHMLAGRPLYESGSLLQAVVQVITEEPDWPTEAEVPAPLIRILKVALAKDPADRYATVAELKADLDAYLRGESGEAGDRLAEIDARRRRRLALSALGGLALCAAVVAGAIGLWHVVDSPAPPAISPSPSGPATPTPPSSEAAFTGLWDLRPGDEFRFRSMFEERETASKISLGSWYVARVASAPPGQVRLEITIEAATVGFGSSLVGGAAFDGGFDTRAPTPSPLSAVGVGVGQRFSFLLHQETGAVSDMTGVDEIGELVARKIRSGDGRGIPTFEPAIRMAFANAFIGQFMETLLHVREAPPLPWTEAPVPLGRRFAISPEGHRPRALRTIATSYRHRAKHVFRFEAEARFANGRLQRSRITQELLGALSRRGRIVPLPPAFGGLPQSVKTTWSFHLQRPGDKPLSDYGE